MTDKEIKLTPKQEFFCKEFLIDLNATQAAIRAGYSENTANRIASQLLSKLDIQKYIQQLMDARSKRVEIDSDYVLYGIKELTERCTQAVPVTDQDGNETGEWKFDATNGFKGYELLGKHLKLFSDKVDHGFDPNAPLNININKTVYNAADKP